MKELLTRQIGPLPVWAYGAGLIVGVAAFFLIRGRLNTGTSAAIPQTNYAPDQLPYPYPDPGSGAGVPPVAPFDTSGSAVTQGIFTNQANFVPPQPQVTPQPITGLGGPDGPQRFSNTYSANAASILSGAQTLAPRPSSNPTFVQRAAQTVSGLFQRVTSSSPAPSSTPSHQRLGGALQ